MTSTHYRGSIDGKIGEFLRDAKMTGRIPTFLGYEPFHQLWAMGAVTPQLTSLRIRNNVIDEHYYVLDETHAEGVDDLEKHQGKKGIHLIEELVTRKGFYWEIDYLHPRVYRQD